MERMVRRLLWDYVRGSRIEKRGKERKRRRCGKRFMKRKAEELRGYHEKERTRTDRKSKTRRKEEEEKMMQQEREERKSKRRNLYKRKRRRRRKVDYKKRKWK